MGNKADTPCVALTSKCVVAVRADGIQLQGPLEAPPIYLGLPELEIIAALSRGPVASTEPIIQEVAASTSSAPDALRSFVKRLRFSARLAEGDGVAQEDVPDHPALALPAQFDLNRPDELALHLPVVLRIRGEAFEIIDHDGYRTARLSPREVAALATLIHPKTSREAVVELGALDNPLDEGDFAELLGRLHASRLLVETDRTASPSETTTPIDREVLVREVFDRHAAAQDETERQRESRTGVHRTKVIPVAFDMGAPAGVGMVVAYAKAYDGGRLEEIYDFRTDWVWSDDRLEQFTSEPAIYLFSNYMWSHARCIAISQRIKQLSPNSITIHGGPDTPRYERDSRAYFATHPHVDVTIRGEGEIGAAEVLAALTSVVGQSSPDLSVLDGIAGISYRGADGVVSNPDRDRVTDLNILPSPILTGLFDVFAEIPELFITLETNRGCPYSCTFCDWGSATNSRVRQFDIERVFAEIDWCAHSGVGSVSIADANFGMIARDVDIAKRAADLRRTYGAPRSFGMNFAKNTVKHLQEIVLDLVDAGFMTQGVLSLQSMDTNTLDTIHRSNIKTEKYDRLAEEMRHARLPLMVELMMGLPGQTPSSFADDLQECINREVPARVNYTNLLVNSPMNDPEYLAAHEIHTTTPVGPGLNAVVISTSSFSEAEWHEMERLRTAFVLYENFGVLRLIARFVQHETGRREIDFYQDVRTATEASPEQWPALYVLAAYGSSMMSAPYSWALLMNDARRFVVSQYGMADDAPLRSVLRAQRAVLPAHGRVFPEEVELEHDVVEWHQTIVAAKEHDHRTDWSEVVPRLAEFGPGRFTVDDPDRITDTSLGINREQGMLAMMWELDSPLSRVRLAAAPLSDWATKRFFGGSKQDRATSAPSGASKS